MRFFDKAMGENGNPNKVTMDKSGVNKATIDAMNADRNVPILVRHVKYLSHIVEQHHRAVIARVSIKSRSGNCALWCIRWDQPRILPMTESIITRPHGHFISSRKTKITH